MALDQLPGQVREFANYLNGLLARLDQAGGWCAVFWQRDPDGMRACLDGREVPPWDVVEALLQDLVTERSPAAVAPELGRARALHTAALTAYDARPGGRDALGDRLDVMLREQRYAAERQAQLSRLLASATTGQEADALRLDLAWARDDHERATARCVELRSRIAELDRQLTGIRATAMRRGRLAGAMYRVGEEGRADDAADEGSGGWRDGRDGRGTGFPQQRGAYDPTSAGGQAEQQLASGFEHPASSTHPAPGFGHPASSTHPAPGFGHLAPSTHADPTPGRPAPSAHPAPGFGHLAPLTHADPTPGRPAPSAHPAPGFGHLAPLTHADQAPGHPAQATHPASGLGHLAPSTQGALDPGHPASATLPAPGFGHPAQSAYADPAPGRPAHSTQPDPAPGRPAHSTQPDPDPEPPARSAQRASASQPPAPSDSAPAQEPPSRKQRKRRRGSARFAGMEVESAGVVVPPGRVEVPAAAEGVGGRTPRGARFAGGVEEADEGVVEAAVEAVDVGAARDVGDAVGRLVRLRAEGRSGEAHALLVEAAHWPAARFPLLAAGLQRAGLSADWATLLWEAASLPAERLVGAADALTAAGRGGDGEQILRQGVARPAGEIGRAVLELAAEGRHREVRALLDAYVRVRTPEEAARSAEPDPGVLVPLLLEAARGVSDERHWDLVHALRVAGLAT
ncbi:hypothetical protein [Streptomyces gilvus]|uniref:hypothetical protein n=1 Tax=Streptomyces gilvus TaxID=2920937 RepID=UPI001F0CF78E|nr:hypothetical protein [Streptomyces sp. CME 23]MCH5670374.1 hypothetical protein [Streptomyces sp. CME 23]